jgi:peptidoglycan/xylan/chitin deacetylase (PgdA/CDA1 family)
MPVSENMRMRHGLLVATILFSASLPLVICDRTPHFSPGKAVVQKPLAPVTSAFAIPVLMYHRIDDLSAREQQSPLMRDLTVSPGAFEDQIKYLAENGFTFLLATDVERALREGKPLPERAIAITMDDGYKDNFEKAFPILEKYHACATIFMVTNNFDKPERLSWNDVLAMRDGGVGYGSHTVSHADLTTLPTDRLDYELVESKRILEKGLGAPIDDIAYPSGEYNDIVIERTKAAGYLAGWKKGGGPVQPGAEAFMLPRVRVRGVTDLADFRKKVWSGYWAMRMNVATKLAATGSTHRNT